MKKCYILLIVFLSGTIQNVTAQDYSEYQKFWLVQNGDTLPYRILLPENYSPGKKYPLILFLHGSGERGNDNEKQLVHGANLFLKKENREKFPAFVVFPQCSQKSYWSNTMFLMDERGERNFYFVNGGEPSAAMKMLLSLMNNLQEQFKIKQDQVYIMGLSMGGMGSYELVNRMSNTFAAAVPICGGGSTASVQNLKNTYWWIFHGAKDNVVLPKLSQDMVKALRRVGASVKFTLYPDANHNSWDAAFAEPDLLKWLFSKKRITINTEKPNN